MDDILAGRARVMTWNIWWRFGPRWQDRQHGVLETLRGVDADVVALQEVWETAETTQAHQFADQLGLHAGFAAPSYPPASDAPRTRDHDGVALGLGLLSRWPITSLRQVEMPARHRTLAPVAMVATLGHPAGLLHVVVACLEYEPAYNDDRIDHIFLRPGQLRQQVVVESAALAGAPVEGLDPLRSPRGRLRPEVDRDVRGVHGRRSLGPSFLCPRTAGR
jgi:hypothetical protein